MRQGSNSTTGSHPVIRFQQIPIVPGPLTHLEKIRPQLLSEVFEKTEEDFSGASLDILLGEALYSERLRLKRTQSHFFTRSRLKKDFRLWNQIHSGLLKPAAEVDRKILLEQVIRHYAGEIGGHFDSRVYQLATRAVPWGFSWLLNAAGVKRFLPWGMTQSLESRLHILGEVPTLQRLAQKGTILLVPTHQSNIDSVLIGYIIYLMSLPPFAYGAGLNLFSNPILSFFMKNLGSYTVDRQKTNLIYKYSLKNYSTLILKEGIHSIFFPGGGRSRSGAIETKVKLGLLGTGLEAQIAGIRAGNPDFRVFVVPMVTSYHSVLEAGSLIESYLEDLGKHRFIATEDESWQLKKVIGFFWKVFSSQSTITVRIGKPLDVFGNLVDDEGHSIGPSGSIIQPVRWLTTRGEVQREAQRDMEYTRELGCRLADRFHKENTVLTSHLVAFAFFETLRRKYPEFDLFRLLRLSLPQRSIPYSDFLAAAETEHRRVVECSGRGEFFLSDDLKTGHTETWVKEGVRQLGLLHDVAVVKVQDEVISTEDMNLLYYYRNRLTGYGFHLGLKQHDSKGFLA